MKCDVAVVAAFLKDGGGGNPAAVVVPPAPLARQQMQHVAATMGLSETVFVSEIAPLRYRCTFFTPVREIAYCGHATIAAFWYLWSIGKIRGSEALLETSDRPLAISRQDSAVYMDQQPPIYQDRLDQTDGVSPKLLQTCLGIVPSDETCPILTSVIASTGLRFLLVQCADESVLSRCRPNVPALTKLSDRLDIIGAYPFALSARDDADIVSRMFAPAYGIQEEAATGMAAGSLACLLYATKVLPRTRIRIEQGRYMDRPTSSELIAMITARDNAIDKIRIGGSGKMIDTRIVDL